MIPWPPLVPHWAQRAGEFTAAARADDCPTVITDVLDTATEEAWEVLLAANSYTDEAEFFFRYGDAPCRLEHTDEGRLVPKRLTTDRLRHRLSQIAWWEKTYKDGLRRLTGAP